jgi:hypothetical protein
MDDDEPLALPPGARTLLRAPDAIVRPLAAAESDPERRWLLQQPRAVRRAFVEEVLDRGGHTTHQRRWMLLQDDAVRLSYVTDVLQQARRPDREAMWLLRQDRAVRESYVAQVLDAL